MNKKGWTLTMIVALVLTGVGFYFSKEKYKEPIPNQISTTTPIVTYIPYGRVVVKVGETVKFKDNSITLLRVLDESRCATGVTCIWAGTVKVEIMSVTGMGTSTEKIELGKFLTTESEKIEVISVTPYPTKDIIISQNMYQVTFEVSEKSDVAVNPNQGACYVGGCSAQICSDTPDMASNCEYKEEYACYKKTSTCKRQPNGQCGWTQTNELKVCLANKPEDTNSLSEADAISVVQSTNSSLKNYPSDKLPPRSITTEKDKAGWYVAFIQNGSGVPIISAQCYFVDSKRTVVESGRYKPSPPENFPSDFSAKACSATKQ